MTHGINGFDHLVVAVSDLEAARETWTRLGFTCTPRGRHRNLATGNYCIMFPRDYVELIGIVDPDLPDRGLMSRMAEGGEGLDRVAFSVADLDRTVAALDGSGIAHRGPLDLHRPLELPSGEVEPRFRLLHFKEADTTPGLHGFICHHETPEITRGEPSWLVHANGVTRVRSVTAVSEAPASLAAGWARLLGAAAVSGSGDSLTVQTGDHVIRVLTPKDLAVAFPEIGSGAGRAAPYLAVAQFVSEDVEAAAAHLLAEGVAFSRGENGDIRIPPEQANGTMVVIGA